MACTRFALLAGLLASVAASGPAPSVEEARATYERALEEARNATAKVKSYIKAQPTSRDEIDKAAESIESHIIDEMKDAYADANEEYRGRLAELKMASGEAKAIHKLAKAVKKAAKESGRGPLKVAKRALHRAKRESLSEAKEVGRDAEAAAHAAYKAAKELKRAQRHSGASERTYEGEFRENEHTTEHMEDYAEYLRGDAVYNVERLFDQVEELLENETQGLSEHGKAHAHRLEREAQLAEDAVKNAMKIAEEATGHEKSKDALKKDDDKKGGYEKGDEGDDEDKEAAGKKGEEDDDEDKEAGGKKGEEDDDEDKEAGGKKGEEDDDTDDDNSTTGVTSGAGESATALAATGLRGLQAGAFVMLLATGVISGYVARARRSVHIHEQPLLG